MKTFKIYSIIGLISLMFSNVAVADFGLPLEQEDGESSTVTLDNTLCIQTKNYPAGEHAEGSSGEMLFSQCKLYCANDCVNKGLEDSACNDFYNNFNSIYEGTANGKTLETEEMNKLCNVKPVPKS